MHTNPYEPTADATEFHARSHSWRATLKTLFRSHAFAFLSFAPFAAMLAVHRILGLSDAMMVAPAPGQPHSLLYNMLMVLAFYFGIGGYVLHATVIADRVPALIAGKLLLLVILWAGFSWAIS